MRLPAPPLRVGDAERAVTPPRAVPSVRAVLRLDEDQRGDLDRPAIPVDDPGRDRRLPPGLLEGLALQAGPEEQRAVADDLRGDRDIILGPGLVLEFEAGRYPSKGERARAVG